MADDFVSVRQSSDFLADFKARAQAMGKDLSGISDDELLKKILAKRPELKDRLILPEMTEPAAANQARATAEMEKQKGLRTKAGLITTASRVLPGLILPGAGDAIGEAAAQRMEMYDSPLKSREAMSPGTVAVQGAVGLMNPFKKVKKGGELLSEVSPFAFGALRGATTTAIGEGSRPITEGQGLPDFWTLAQQAAFGGALGGAANKFVPPVAKWLGSKLGMDGGGPMPRPVDDLEPPMPAQATQAPQPQKPFNYPDAPGVMSTQPPPMPPGFRAEAYIKNPNEGLRNFNEGGQMTLPGMPIPNRFPGPGAPQEIEQALMASPEGQALFKFMQEGSAGKPYWNQKGISKPKAAKVPKPKVPVQADSAVSVADTPALAPTPKIEPTPLTQPAAVPEVAAPQPTFRPGRGATEAAGVSPAATGPLADIEAQIEALRIKPGEPHDPARVARIFKLIEQRNALKAPQAGGFTGDALDALKLLNGALRREPRPGTVQVEDGVHPFTGQAAREMLDDLGSQYGEQDLVKQIGLRVRGAKNGYFQPSTNTMVVGDAPSFLGKDIITTPDIIAHEFRHARDFKRNPEIFAGYPYGNTKGNPDYLMHPSEISARGESNVQGFQRESDRAGQLTLPREEIIRPIAESTDRGRMQLYLDELAVPEGGRNPPLRWGTRQPEQLDLFTGQRAVSPDEAFRQAMRAPERMGTRAAEQPAGTLTVPHPQNPIRGSVTDENLLPDMASLLLGGAGGAALDPEDPWTGGLIGAATVWGARRGLKGLSRGKAPNRIVNEALEAWKARGKSIPADDVAATEAWMREGRELLGSHIGDLGNSIQDVAKRVEAGVRLRHPDAFAGKVVEGVEGRTPKTNETFVRQEPTAIPKNERIQPGRIPLARLDNIGLDLGKMPEEVRPGLETMLSDLSKDGALEIQRRGVQPIKLIEQLASRQKVRIDKPGKPGTAYNSEELLAMAYATAGAQKKVDDLAPKMNAVDVSDVDRMNFTEALLQNKVTTLTLSGAAAEAGRAMRTLQVIRNVMQIGNPELIQRAIRESGGEQKLRYIAKELAKLPDDLDLRRAKLNELLDDGAVRYWERAFQASLLSSARLHLLNSMSNSFNTLYRAGALPFRAGVGSVQGALGKERGFEWEAVKPAALGLLTGARNGLTAARFVWKHGVTPGQASGMSGNAFGLNSGRFDVPMPEFGTKGYGPMNLPNAGYNKVLRALGAADQFFSTMNTQSARMGIATTVARGEARAQKLTGPKLNSYMDKRVPEILLKEDLTLENLAFDEGRMSVGQEDMGKIGNMLLGVRENAGSGFLMPFIKTTLNFARQGVELSPAAPLSGQWRDAVLRNPENQAESIKQAEALGRTIMGSLALTGFGMAKQAGYFNLQGAMPPKTDPQARQKFLNEGRQPYSVELSYKGEQYAIPFRVLGPLSIPLGAMADAFNVMESAEKESDKLDILRRLATNFSENTAFGQVIDLAEMADDPTKMFNYVTRIAAATATPAYGLMNDVSRGQDQTIREKPQAARLIDELGWVKGAGTATAQQMPVLGGLLTDDKRTPLMGPLGEPMDRFTPDWVPPAVKHFYHGVTPVPVSKITPERGDIKPLQRDWQIGPKSAPIDLTIKGEAELRKAKGEATAKALERLEANEQYQALPDAQKQAMRDKLVAAVRSMEARKTAAKTMKERK